MWVDHIGIATDDLEALATVFCDLLETEIVHEETFDGMTIAFLAGESTVLELLEPADDGPISQYLDSHGPGIHHLAFRTSDIQATLAHADNLGIDRIDETPRPGAWGHTVAFLHPSDTGGVLIEFVEH